MASLESLQTRALAAVGAIQLNRDDAPVAIRVRALTAAGSVTSVTVTTATNIVFVSSLGGTQTYAFATYTTVGALADAITADGKFEAVVLDALRSDATNASNFNTGAITAGTDLNGVTVWDVTADTSVNKFITAALSIRRNWDAPKRGHRVHLQEIVYNVDVSAGAANAVRVYFRDRFGTETQVFGKLSVDVTITTINWAAGIGKLTAPENAEIIVRVQDATSVTDNAANFVQATGIIE